MPSRRATTSGRASILYTWDPYSNPSILKLDGEMRWKDLVPGVTLREELDEGTGLRSLVVTADPERELHPSVLVYAPEPEGPAGVHPGRGEPHHLRLADRPGVTCVRYPGGSQPVVGEVVQGGRAPDQRGVAEPEQEGEQGQDGVALATGQGEEGRHRHQDPARGLQDARHHRRPPAHRRAVRGPSARRIRRRSRRPTAS